MADYEIPITNEQEDVKELETNSNDQDNYVEMLQRLKAEFENYKKRVEKEKMELSSLIKSELIYKLLPIIDDFERMFNNSNSEQEHILNGSKLIYEKLISSLKEEGLEPIESVGKEFDPEIHEAVMIEAGEEDKDNLIVEELQKGYLFNSKLLRPAKVKVYKTNQE